MDQSTRRTDEWRLKPIGQIRVDVVVPVLNEAHVLERNLTRLHRFLDKNVPFAWRIVIAENGSTDGTGAIARERLKSARVWRRHFPASNC